MKKRKIANTVADSTLPKTPITIGGKTYNLCFDLGALSEAETLINAELIRANRSDLINLLFALPVQNLANTRKIFACGIRTFHPELSYEEALKLLTVDALYEAATAIRLAWTAANPEAKDPSDPSRAGK